MKNPVRTTTLEVVKKAREVKIDYQKIKEVVEEWTKKKIVIPSWPTKYHLQIKDQRKMLDYLIILDSLNFCFWPKYNYFAFSLALKKFFETNPQKANLEYFSKIPQKEFYSIFGKNLQYLKKRWKIVKAVGSALIKKYGNSGNFINSAKQKTSILVAKIYKELPYFNDIYFYNGQKVYFLKRAQILIADIWGAFEGKKIGYFKDLDYLTAFADYKLPQILHHLGVLEYSPALEKKIKTGTIISPGSREEIEIRSCTIWAIEYLKESLAKLGKNFYSFEIDWILWNMSQKLKTTPPNHLTKTIFY